MSNPSNNERDVDAMMHDTSKQRPTICTIIAKNYLASARTLTQSFLAHHPDGKVYVLVVDDFTEYINPAAEQFEIVELSTLGIPDLQSFCFGYTIVELCTAAKPFLLEHLIVDKSVDKLFYLDPDILVTNSLTGLFSKLDTHDIILTPHLDADFPDDGCMPDDSVIMTHGVFNLGFIGVNGSDNTRTFLTWWQTKVQHKCVTDLHRGYFVDQKFIDLVPTLFSNYYIERNPGYNVAWWNLHSRLIRREGDTWYCNDDPLYFYHFSNYRPEKPDVIARFTSRHTMSNRPDLVPLFEHYRELLIRNGYEHSSKWPYTYDYFHSGERISRESRWIYRRAGESYRHFGNPFESASLRRKLLLVSQLQDEARFSKVLRFLYKITSPGIRLYKKLFVLTRPTDRVSDVK